MAVYGAPIREGGGGGVRGARTRPPPARPAVAAREEAEATPPSTRCASPHYAFARPRSWPSLASTQGEGREGAR
jgi:hypothetical protein